MLSGRNLQGTEHVVHTSYGHFLAVDSSGPSPREVDFGEDSQTAVLRHSLISQLVRLVGSLVNRIARHHGIRLAQHRLKLLIGHGLRTAELADGSHFGIHLTYAVQESPDGLAQAFLIGEEFIGEDACAMILGDNIFYGNGFSEILAQAREKAEAGRATIFGYYVRDPERFGVVEFDENEKVISVEEKPANPKSNYAITGLYFYPKGVSRMAKQVEKSPRGELEITTLNDLYLQRDVLDVKLLGRGFAWLDTGTMESLLEAAEFVHIVERRQGVKISAPEEIAFRFGWISTEELLESAQAYGKSPYGNHLRQVAEDKFTSFKKNTEN